MRRQSDRGHGERTGGGRRARDRLLEGTTQSPALSDRRELENLVLFLGDDLRESALAMGGIESFMLRAQQVLENPDLSPEELQRLLDEGDVAERMELLWDALSSLRRSMGLIHENLKNG
jgi:hypothetical protein